MNDINVVMMVYNRPQYFRQVLDSLKNQTVDFNLHVISNNPKHNNLFLSIIDKYKKHFNINLDFADEDEVETVGGLVFSKINRIPKDNEEFNIDDIVNIKVLRANERKILTVQIRKIVN